MRKHTLLIELAGLVIVIFLLCWKFQRQADLTELLREGEHKPVTVDEEQGIITDADGNIVWNFERKTTEPAYTTPVPTATPTVVLSEIEQKRADLPEEYRKMYDKATIPVIPEGIAFAMVEESLAIRKKANAESVKVGILYPDNCCRILEWQDGDEWAKVQTGTVTGYCRASYLMKGDEAVQHAKETMTCTAVTIGNTNLRSGPTTQEQNVITAVGSGTKYTVLEPAVFSDDPNAPLFVKVRYKEQEAYLAMGRVTITYGWKEGKAQ